MKISNPSTASVAIGVVLLVGACSHFAAPTRASSPDRGIANRTFGLAVESATSGASGPSQKRMPGISRGTISCGVKDGKTMFVIWADRESEESSCRELRGDEFLCRSGFGEVACECVTSDGKTGTCWIGVRNARWPAEATRYDLADGAFFLLSTQGATPRVRQMQRDLANVASEMKVFEGLAKSDAEIRDFFAEHKAAE
jgi:hypothetical protein